MSAYDDAECTTHFYNGKMEITSPDGSINLTGTRCNDNLYYLDSHHIERALAFANRSRTYPHSIPESKSDTSGTDTVEDVDTETSEFMSEDDDESHHTEESEDAQTERWYRENGMFNNMEEMEEMFDEHIEEIQDPNHPFNRRSSNVVGTSEVCMSSKLMVNDSNENLIVESDDKPSQSGNTQYLIGSRTEKKSMKEQLDLNWKFLQLHRKLGHMSENQIKRAFNDQKALFPKGVSKDLICHGHLGICIDCKSGGMRMRNHGETSAHSWKVLEKIAVDYKGPFKVTTGDKRYSGFYLFSDYKSNYVYPYLVKSKTELLSALQKMLIKLHNRCNAQMKMLQGDADSVFLSEDVQSFLLNKECDLQTSPPHFKSANGQVESDMKRLLNKCRTIMHENNAPANLWGYALRY
jgi:hypothetical protein